MVEGLQKHGGDAKENPLCRKQIYCGSHDWAWKGTRQDPVSYWCPMRKTSQTSQFMGEGGTQESQCISCIRFSPPFALPFSQLQPHLYWSSDCHSGGCTVAFCLQPIALLITRDKILFPPCLHNVYGEFKVAINIHFNMFLMFGNNNTYGSIHTQLGDSPHWLSGTKVLSSWDRHVVSCSPEHQSTKLSEQEVAYLKMNLSGVTQETISLLLPFSAIWGREQASIPKP